MNWEAIGAIGELVGALGVILTLAYLAIQIRQNTKSTDKQNRRDAMEFVYTSSRPMIDDSELAEIYLRGMDDFHSLTDVEKLRFHYLCTTRIQAATTAIELLTDQAGFNEMHGWVNRMMGSKGFRDWWAARGKYIAAASFRLIGDQMWQNHIDSGETLAYAETYRDEAT